MQLSQGKCPLVYPHPGGCLAPYSNKDCKVPTYRRIAMICSYPIMVTKAAELVLPDIRSRPAKRNALADRTSSSVEWATDNVLSDDSRLDSKCTRHHGGRQIFLIPTSLQLFQGLPGHAIPFTVIIACEISTCPCLMHRIFPITWSA